MGKSRRTREAAAAAAAAAVDEQEQEQEQELAAECQREAADSEDMARGPKKKRRKDAAQPAEESAADPSQPGQKKARKRSREHAEAEVQPDAAESARDSGRAPVADHHVTLRCAQPLYVLIETLTCASRGCVSCCHKILAGEELPARAQPNVRPELCPRASGQVAVTRADGVGLYPADSFVLTVGDGDLSFSQALARSLGPDHVTATTWETRQELLASYDRNVYGILKHLKETGVVVHHQVDAARLQDHFGTDEGGWNSIVFNFPCVAPPTPGLDGQLAEIDQNQQLLEMFGECAAGLLQESGQLHVSHKTKAAFGHWGVCERVCSRSGLVCVGAVVFDRCAYPGYVNRKAKDNKSFPVSDAVTFCFQHPASAASLSELEFEAGDSLAGVIKRARRDGWRLVPVSVGVVRLVAELLLR